MYESLSRLWPQQLIGRLLGESRQVVEDGASAQRHRRWGLEHKRNYQARGWKQGMKYVRKGLLDGFGDRGY